MVDCLITLVFLMLSIACYHGLWKVEEDFIVSYAKNSHEVDMVGVDLCLIVVSVNITVFGYISEFFLLWLHAQNVPSLVKLLCYQAMLLLVYFADVTLFCALWHLQDQLLLPDNEVLSNLVSHLGGFFCMVFLGVANTLHGGFMRERYRLVDGIMIGRFYLTYFFRKSSNSRSAATQTERRYLEGRWGRATSECRDRGSECSVASCPLDHGS